jgi:hypothetical protein
MWFYLKICGPLLGRPPDRYPLHHGISARKSAVEGDLFQKTNRLDVSELFNFELSPKELASNIRYPSNALDYSSTSPTTQHSKQTITDAIDTSTIHHRTSHE